MAPSSKVGNGFEALLQYGDSRYANVAAGGVLTVTVAVPVYVPEQFASETANREYILELVGLTFII